MQQAYARLTGILSKSYLRLLLRTSLAIQCAVAHLTCWQFTICRHKLLRPFLLRVPITSSIRQRRRVPNPSMLAC